MERLELCQYLISQDTHFVKSSRSTCNAIGSRGWFTFLTLRAVLRILSYNIGLSKPVVSKAHSSKERRCMRCEVV